MKQSITDKALSTIYSPEVDQLRSRGKKWLIASQLSMLVAMAPMILAFVGVITSIFSDSEGSFFPAAFAWIFGGITVSVVTIVIFFPIALLCVYKFYTTRKKIAELVADSIRESNAERDAIGNSFSAS